MLRQVNLVVREMEASIAFCRRLGFAISEAAIWRSASGAHHVTIAMPGGIDLELDSIAMTKHFDAGWTEQTGTGRIVIGFSLPSRDAVDERYADLTSAGHRGLQPPHDAFWGSRYAIVEDPDGNHVGLMSPMDFGKQSAPPAI